MGSSRALPTGVVTFLLTDIEGSTRRWEREPEPMRRALTRHDELVTAGVDRHNGHVIKSKGEGDSVFAVFEHVRDAVRAALAIQLALAVETWATSTPLSVRMAIHTGEIELRHGDYYGPTVNRCARLRSIASGGQVLLSSATAKLTREHLPPGASLVDLGTQTLKDLSAPERIWQLIPPETPEPATMPSGPSEARIGISKRRLYKLTDHFNRSSDGRQWGPGICHESSDGRASDDDGGGIRCYTTPAVAALLNAQYERYRMPRLWEASADQTPSPDQATLVCHTVNTNRQVALPTVTGQHHAVFAVLCARAACVGARHEHEFANWADCWLAGQDSSGIDARQLAEMLETEANQTYGRVDLDVQMLADAAHSAMHAARLSWLKGRERDEKNAQAIKFGTEAVRTALRLTHMDLPAFADQAIPSANAVLAR